MTLGEHIQALRREAGLSQEGLGEALGVSRQAVSKWESDGAIPELNTLIAMSRLFHVTLGQLLQVEEPEPEPDGEVEERREPDWSQVEAIMGRYLKEAEARRAKPRRWTRAAAVLLVIGGIWMFLRMNDMGAKLNRLESQLYTTENRLSNEVSGLTWSLSHLLEEQNSLLADYTLDISDVDLEQEKVTCRFTAALKSWQEGTRAQLVVDWQEPDGQERQVTSDLLEGPDFASELEVPFHEGGKVSLRVYTPEGTTQIQRLSEDSWMFDARRYGLELSASFSGTTGNFSPNDGGETVQIGFDYSVKWWVSQPKDDLEEWGRESVRPVELTLLLYHNRRLAEEVPLPPETWEGQGQTIRGTTSWAGSVEMAEGDTLTYALRCTDSYGRVRYYAFQYVRMRKDDRGNWEMDNDAMGIDGEIYFIGEDGQQEFVEPPWEEETQPD